MSQIMRKILNIHWELQSFWTFKSLYICFTSAITELNLFKQENKSKPIFLWKSQLINKVIAREIFVL